MLLMLFLEKKRSAAERAFPGIITKKGVDPPLQESFAG
jgi:hypothetical protein